MFELHLAFTNECLLAMQGQYGFQAYLEMCLDGRNIHKVAITRILIQAQENHFWGHRSAISIIECKKIMWFVIRLYSSMLTWILYTLLVKAFWNTFIWCILCKWLLTFWFKKIIYCVVLCQIFEGHLQGAQSDFTRKCFFKGNAQLPK